MKRATILSWKSIAGRWALLVMVSLLGAMSGCVTNPATGESEFSLLSREDEIALGQEGDAQIVAEFGVYDDAAVAAYVDSLGQALARNSDDPNLVWTFRVLDSPVINAFALPGGFVYVTRGLLAYLQDEAQLAVVLGHEIGHVTARHTARQYTSSQLAQLGVGLGSILFEDVRPFLGAVETGLELLFLKYSRDDERQADELGVKYATKIGYKASEGSRFFGTLKRVSDQEQGGALPTWASTHPDPAEREQTVLNLAAQYAGQFPGDEVKGTDSSAFIPRFDKIVFGQNPRHGFVQGGVFYHPDLRFQFNVPSGWAVGNFASQVQLAPNVAQPDAAILLGTQPDGDPQSAAQQFVSANGATVQESQAGTVNGLSAYRLRSSIQLEDGSSITVLSYFIRKSTPEGTLLFVFHGYSSPAQFGSYVTTFTSVFNSFNEVTNGAVLAVVPNRLDVFNAPRTDQFSALVQTGAGLTVEDLAIMNQRQTSDQVQAGAVLKQVR